MKTKWVATTVALVLVIVLAVVLFQSCETSPEPSEHEVKVGYLRHPGYLPLFCADHLEYFEETGVLVTLVPFESSPAMMAAFLAGDIEVVPVATATALATESRDAGRFKVFAISSETVTDYLTSIVTMPADVSGIHSIQDLRGRVVGVFPGPAAATLFGLVFEEFGLTSPEDFELRALGPPLHVQALASGQVDALATYEPYATQAVVEYGAVKLIPAAVESYVLSPTQGGSWLISTDLLREHPAEADAFIAAIDMAIDAINERTVNLAVIIAAYTPVEAEIAGQIPIVTYAKLADIDLEAYQAHADLMFENGVISKPIDVTTMLLEQAP